MKNETFRTRKFNVVTNEQHGACLMFDSKGLGVSQSLGYRHNFLMLKSSSVTKMLNTMVVSLRAQIISILVAQKQQLLLRSRNGLV